MKPIYLIFSTIAVIALSVLSCNKPDKTDDTDKGNFDKTAMLVQYADNQIIPAYATLQTNISELQAAIDAFASSPNSGTQAALKTAYANAHLQYIRCGLYNFGPAETAILDNFFNFTGGLDYSFTTDGALTGFSVDTATILNNIATSSNNFTSLSRASFYAQGFPALNYLCFEPNAIANMDAKRAQYLKDIVARMKTLSDKVAADWASYRSTFVGNTQSNSGSPIANIVNQIAYQMDVLKGPCIGWPLGKASNGTVFASKCEAYYAGISLALAKERIAGIKSFYSGNGSGKGLSDYLVSLGQAQLNTDILAQMDIVATKLNDIADPLPTALTSQYPAVDATYKEIQKLVTLVKTDLPSVTAVQISYADNDGD